METERDAVAAELASTADSPNVVTLHPGMIDRYRQQVDELQAPSTATAGNTELVAAFRALVAAVVIHPQGAREPYDFEIKGRLAALTASQAFPKGRACTRIKQGTCVGDCW